MKLGKIGKINQQANVRLKRFYGATDIRSCELRLDGCTGSYALSFAHRHKRNWYLGRPELLSSFNQTVLGCVNCHQIIEKDPELTKKKFLELRGEECIG